MQRRGHSRTLEPVQGGNTLPAQEAAHGNGLATGKIRVLQQTQMHLPLLHLHLPLLQWHLLLPLLQHP
jgi:hypothetical protein